MAAQASGLGFGAEVRGKAPTGRPLSCEFIFTFEHVRDLVFVASAFIVMAAPVGALIMNRVWFPRPLAWADIGTSRWD